MLLILRHAESFTSVCENCLHRPNESMVKETKARAGMDEVNSALCSSKFRMDPLIATERTKMYVFEISMKKTSNM